MPTESTVEQYPKGTHHHAKVWLTGLMALAAFSNCTAYAETSKADAAYPYIMKARAAAGDDLHREFYHRCFVDADYASTIARYRKTHTTIEPAKVFDNLFCLNSGYNSVWILKTTEGLIAFDSFNNPGLALQLIGNGLPKLGLDPNQIKYVVISHEDGDHFGGAQFLKDRYGARLMASEAAWQEMAAGDQQRRPNWFVYAPKRDLIITDGQQFTLGDATVTFYITPGHDPGAISAIFKVTDNGVPHVVGYMGGMGVPAQEPDRNLLIKTYARWQEISAKAGVDTLIANHAAQDSAIDKVEFLRVRRAGDWNPLVLGADAYRRYYEVQKECIRARLVISGQRVEE